MPLDVDPVDPAGVWLRHIPRGANPHHRPQPPGDSRWQRGREAIQSAVPIKVAIIESGIESRTGSFGRTFYAPRIRYAVRTPDGSFIARRVTPLEEAYTEGWAREIAERYRVGHVEPGFAEKGDPALHLTFLVPELGTFFYWTLAAGAVVFGALALIWRRAYPAKQ